MQGFCPFGQSFLHEALVLGNRGGRGAAGHTRERGEPWNQGHLAKVKRLVRCVQVRLEMSFIENT